MIVREMTASFGGLSGEKLALDPGLNIVTAPNESGKSTWAGFLRAMLYGVNTRERDRDGYLADKNRYQPWSGAPMSGELRLTWRGEDVVLRRFAQKNNPFGGFEAVYEKSGDPVPGLTSAGAGETLTGVGREAYENSAFVGQGGAAVSGAPELEKRVAALATTGQEDVSCSEAEKKLRGWLNRRRHNRTGLIPQMEDELFAIERKLETLERARRVSEEAEERASMLTQKKAALEREQELHRAVRRRELDRRYAAALSDWRIAQAAVPQEKPHPLFGSMTADEAWEAARKKDEEKRRAEEENRRRAEERSALGREREQRKKRNAAAAAVLLVFAAALLAAGAALRLPLLAVEAVWPAAGLAFSLWNDKKKDRALEGRLQELADLPVPDPGDILDEAARYREELSRREAALERAAGAQKLVSALESQGARLPTEDGPLTPPARSEAETAAQLASVSAELERARGDEARAAGEMGAVGDPEVLRDRREELESAVARRTLEYDAISTALDALGEANTALRERFSPALNARAAEIFARLTGGKYDRVAITRTFEALAAEAGSIQPRRALALSAGTAEQLYLAVRLALCDMTLGGDDPAPVVLDDALCAFDDARMALALDYLKELSARRQVILFSCQKREGDWAERNGARHLSLQNG